ncbi:MAG: stage III sporulation protein AD [Ruminococcaceae bacterium]|nr:stage III sporulation protein AD [Oscillospiraceae bacterium]
MNIFQIVIIGITGTLLTIILKQYKGEFALVSALITGSVILLCALGGLEDVIQNIYEIATKYNVNTAYIATVIKIIAIAYICQFSSEICRDSGQGAIASKIEFCAKILILLYSLPIADSLLSLVVSILP